MTLTITIDGLERGQSRLCQVNREETLPSDLVSERRGLVDADKQPISGTRSSPQVLRIDHLQNNEPADVAWSTSSSSQESLESFQSDRDKTSHIHIPSTSRTYTDNEICWQGQQNRTSSGNISQSNYFSLQPTKASAMNEPPSPSRSVSSNYSIPPSRRTRIWQAADGEKFPQPDSIDQGIHNLYPRRSVDVAHTNPTLQSIDQRLHSLEGRILLMISERLAITNHLLMANLHNLSPNRGGHSIELERNQGSRGLENRYGIDFGSSRPRQPPDVRPYGNGLTRGLGGRHIRPGDPLGPHLDPRFPFDDQPLGSHPADDPWERILL